MRKTLPISNPPATSAATSAATPAATPAAVKPTPITKPAIEVIPNELKITINTSIPGFQTIKYNSSMTIKNKDKNQVCFNPLVKLDKDVIQKIPERIRISEFFNKGLFESLINTHGMTKVKTLKEATNKGYVDHNIKVTLDTIFPTGSVIYINSQSYAIADIQWTKGDWKVDTKEKSVEIDRSKIKNPLIYANIVKEEIITGQQQLQELQKDTPSLLSGPNYIGPKIVTPPPPVAPAVIVTPPVVTPPVVTPPVVTPPVVTPPAATTSTAIVPFKKPTIPSQAATSSAIVPFKKPLLVIPPKPPLPALPPAEPLPAVPPKPPKPLPALPPAVPSSDRIEVIDESEDESEDEEEQLPSIPVLPECILNYNAGTHRPSRALRGYFADGNYYNLVNEIFLRMDDATKEIIRNYLTASTTVNIDYTSRNLSQIAYAQLIPGMRIVANNGGGDCLFLAVSTAINCYNREHPRAIKSNIPGNVNFTPAQLRQLVYEYLISDKGNLPSKQIMIDANKELLNERFLQEMTQEDDGSINYGISDADYLALINNTYVSLPNFLIKKPIIVPDRNSPEFIRPFNNIDLNDREEIRNYILSNQYWGDQESLNALCDKLKLNIIVIHYNPDLPNVNHRFQIASGNLRTTDICNNWNKYLFVFESNSHYELITFTYTTLVPSKSKVTNFVRESKTYTIFNNDYGILPPIYILFFIYGSKYFTSAPQLNAKLLPDIFNSIDTAFLDIIQEENQDTIDFFTSFNNFFPSSLRSREIIEMTERSLNSVSSSGGANNFIKSEDKRDSSKICYYITIDMELQKGTNLSEEQMSDAKCRQKWNAVRKAYANFTGKKYVIPPVYDYSKNKTQKQPLKSNTNQNTKNNKSYLNTSRNNGTRKYNSQELYQGSKRNKTIKNY